MTLDDYLDWIHNMLNHGHNVPGISDDTNGIFDAIINSGIDLSQLSYHEMHTLIEQLSNQGIDINGQDLIHKAGNNMDTNISFGCSCGGNCYMVCQNSCASACLSEYSH